MSKVKNSNKLNSTKNWINEKLIPKVGKLGNQRHLSAIRDAFAIFTPIIIAGAMAVLMRSVVFSDAGGKGSLSGLFVAWNDFVPQGGYLTFLKLFKGYFLYLQVGTINCMSLYIAFGIGFFLSRSRGNTAPEIAGLLCIAAFLSVTNLMLNVPWDSNKAPTWEGGMYWIGARGLISAIIVSMIATELYCWMSKGNKLAIKMPSGVPPAVSKAFAKLFPVIFTLLIICGINWIVWIPFSGVSSSPLVNRTLPAEGAGIDHSILLKGGATTLVLQGKTPAGDITVLGAANSGASSETVAAFKKMLNTLQNLKTTSDKDFLQLLHGIKGTENVKDVTNLAFKNGAGAYTPATLVAVKSIVEQSTQIDIALHGGATLTSLIYAGVVAPFLGLASNQYGGLGIAILYVVLISLFWFFGLHGTNIINGAFAPIWLILLANNINGDSNVFVQGTFDAYIFIGGWGATLPLLVATLAFGKRDSAEYEVSKFAIAPGFFQINEPVTFGYPLVLNWMLILPLMLIMPILTVTTYMGIQWFGVPKVIALIPWTIPVGFGGLIASASPWGFVLAVVNFAIATALWTPFVLMLKYKANNEEKNLKINEDTNSVKTA
ncbi:PTS sugar transporter subunit IIC [Mycoplasma marinum]|uniref:PTS EIIC type-3 domain-containing protein n=1 Tax=Mycoplasma marinum TaxID=1937190 RepID=A0A4R0XP25_9MOLU|nr:PTS transporter subunit EIIC [Mycoplasma marinum]TCG10715.1 hypothetical protein C4B24_04180 [Mycoplasma marinum]